MAQYTLMKHQAKAVKFLKKMDGVGALLFDPGVGKTGSTLAYLDSLADEQGEVRVLVVSPLAASDTWVLQPPFFMDSPVKARMLQGSTRKIMAQIAQARDWANVPDAKISADVKGEPSKVVSGNRVTIISITSGAVSSWCTDAESRASMVRVVRKYQPHVIIVDESHTIKSATSNISVAMHSLGMVAPRRIILTGTVTPNSPLDVYGQWRFLAPWTFSDHYNDPRVKNPTALDERTRRSLRPWSWTTFKNRYALHGGYKSKQIVGYMNGKELQDRMGQRAMVVRKADALDLPPVTDVTVHVDLSPRERKAYADMKRDLAAQMADGSLLEATNALAKIMKLRQITAGFIHNTDDGVTHQLGSSKRKAVCDVVNTTLAGENRVVVFAYFKSECAALEKALQQKGRTVEIVTGATSADERLAIRKRFADTTNHPEQIVLVAQARTMSLAVNELVTAQNAVFASVSERRADWVQARDRLDRNGQTGAKVTFWNVVVPDSIDEVMLKTHRDKSSLEGALLDHIAAHGGAA
jgi:SNF2 family DNA or RNA helicase